MVSILTYIEFSPVYSSHVHITSQVLGIIKSTKQSILCSDNKPWVKKSDIECDVRIGSWDGADICELLGLYILSQLQNLNIQVGLYRDDGLGAATQCPEQVENIKKKNCQVFSDIGLKITVEANKKIVNFLDVSLDLSNNTFKPYLKPNSPIT